MKSRHPHTRAFIHLMCTEHQHYARTWVYLVIGTPVPVLVGLTFND